MHKRAALAFWPMGAAWLGSSVGVNRANGMELSVVALFGFSVPGFFKKPSSVPSGVVSLGSLRRSSVFRANGFFKLLIAGFPSTEAFGLGL